MTFSLPIPAEANALLDRSSLAVLLGLVLDQQITMEKAFTSPLVLVQRLGHEPTATELADFDPAALLEFFATPPALHRFPKAMATRVQEVCRVIADRYDGDVAALWRDVPTGAELYQRIVALPGFGQQKAQIFVALLGKQCGVQPTGWREAAGGYGGEGAYRSVADIVDDASLTKVREYKKAAKAEAKATKS
ncbi:MULTISPECIES: HhH-GPD-type base excision DNA repair protein [Actinoplanes]|uniref:Fe-S cluster assembly protein HesB n=2 Tax=Actinoplanes TaxID=1865 RepID=A0A0X3UTP1_9ACTN|nr:MULTISPECIES: HhH-GPD-type base excision DNA repair protein [Actinoplanes]KUL35953.1 Fe-S cluster assembly protein HesB [Actinoplanes awajinensis subsp. mycoplanecinus]GIE65694.1 (Fe-S)-cluster assembly protein [Actinoplanes palleronii]